MNAQDDRITKMLKLAMPPVETSAEPSRDLWPAMLRRMDAEAAKAASAAMGRSKWIWFDWALLAGLAAIGLVFPASIPLLLYYL